MAAERAPASEDAFHRLAPEFWAWFEDRILRALDRRDRALAARICEGTRARVERVAGDTGDAEDAGVDAHPVELLRWDVEA